MTFKEKKSLSFLQGESWPRRPEITTEAVNEKFHLWKTNPSSLPGELWRTGCNLLQSNILLLWCSIIEKCCIGLFNCQEIDVSLIMRCLRWCCLILRSLLSYYYGITSDCSEEDCCSNPGLSGDLHHLSSSILRHHLDYDRIWIVVCDHLGVFILFDDLW